jgi:hypothetical protein
MVTEKNTAGTFGTLADSGSNSYTASRQNALANAIADGTGSLFTTVVTTALVNTNTITFTKQLSTSAAAISAFYFTGVTGEDTAIRATATGTTGTITVTSGTPGSNSSLFIGVLCDSGSSAAGGAATFTQATGWLPAGGFEAKSGTGSGNARVDAGWKLAGGTGTQAYAPTLSSTAQQWALFIIGAKVEPDSVILGNNLPWSQPLDYYYNIHYHRTWLDWFTLELIGQDKFPSGRPTNTFLAQQLPWPSGSYQDFLSYPVQLRTLINANNPLTQPLRLADTNLDWPVPTAPYRIEQTLTVRNFNVLQPKPNLTITQTVYDLPAQPPRIEQTVTFRNILNLTPPSVSLPDLLKQRTSLNDPIQPDYHNQLRTLINAPAPTAAAVVTIPLPLVNRPYEWPVSSDAYIDKLQRSFSEFFNPNLIGMDHFPPGENLTGGQNATGTPVWGPEYPVNLRTLTNSPAPSAPAAITIPPPLLFSTKDWPLPVPPPRLDQTIAAFYNRNLIGKDVLPKNQSDWPIPTAPSRLDETWLQSFNQELRIGTLNPLLLPKDWPNPITPYYSDQLRTLVNSPAGTAAVVTFQPAWARGSNIVVEGKATP